MLELILSRLLLHVSTIATAPPPPLHERCFLCRFCVLAIRSSSLLLWVSIRASIPPLFSSDFPLCIAELDAGPFPPLFYMLYMPYTPIVFVAPSSLPLLTGNLLKRFSFRVLSVPQRGKRQGELTTRVHDSSHTSSAIIYQPICGQ